VWRTKRIGFYSNIGHGDIGDDAAFYVAQTLLGADMFPLSKKCYAFNPRMLRALLISGGGALRLESPYIPRRLGDKQKWPFPVALCGVGVNCDYGKTYTEETKDKIRRLCACADYIAVRDQYTVRFLRELGFPDVRVLPDLDLALSEEPMQSPLIAAKKKYTVGIVLTPHSEFGDKTFAMMIDVFAKFVSFLADQGNAVVCFPFEGVTSDNTRERDLIAAIRSRVTKPEHVHVCSAHVSPHQLVYIMRTACDLMVCMRMHSAVFAAAAGVPFIGISYNMMHDGFFEMIGATDRNIRLHDQFSFETLQDAYQYVVCHYREIKQQQDEKRDILRTQIYNEIAHIRKVLALP